MITAPVAIIGNELDELTIMPFIGRILVSQNNGRDRLQALFLSLPPEVKQTIYLLAGINQPTLDSWSYYTSQHPCFRVEMSEPLKDLINNHCIYDAAEVDKYFLELLSDRRLFLRNNAIISSRYLGQLTPGAFAALTSLCAGKLMAMPMKDNPRAARASATQTVPDDVAVELGLLKVNGQKVLLPEVQLRKYAAIKQMMLNAGGKYGKGGFTFPVGINPQEVLDSLLGGKKVNVQQETQSFFTPQELGNEVCGAVGDLSGKRILEPSAGNAALADIAKQAGAEVVVIENHPVNINQLAAKGYDVIERDFLTVSPDEIGLFDAIVANPPFTRNQDIEHVNHMWKFLKPGGILSVITSTSWYKGTQKKQKEFADFLNKNAARVTHIDAGAFKASGTGVPTIHVVTQKTNHLMQEARCT